MSATLALAPFSDFLLEEYAKDPEVIKEIIQAYESEAEYRKGVELPNDVQLQAYIDDYSGLWEFTLYFHHGEVAFISKDESMFEWTIQSMPSLDMIDISDPNNKLKEGKLEEAKRNAQKGFRRSFKVDLRNARLLTEAKNFFEKDFVLSQVKYEDGSTGAKTLIEDLREFRKNLHAYNQSFSYLWQDTDYNNAIILYQAMKEKKLIS